MYQRGQLGKIRIGEETIEREDECAVRLFQATLFIPWLSLTYRTDHITPIPPNRAMLRLTGWSVNTSKIHLPLQSLSLSSDPEQDMFSSNHCQRVSENSATPSLILFVTLSSLGLLFPERSKQRRQERCTCAIVRDRYFLDTRLHLCLLACLTSARSIPLGSFLQQMSWFQVPTAPSPPLPSFHRPVTANPGPLTKHEKRGWWSIKKKMKDRGKEWKQQVRLGGQFWNREEEGYKENRE